ncbi:MAG: cyclic pyranopterin monophosphate synthase MoaC [Firmicutes bacterium]|nr:cyclic pyranopterin monophosphate synthase MoaC [Bacillota bacterium]
MENKLSHINEQGHARMVNVTEKAQTVRTAIAKGEIYMAPETLDLIQSGGMPKGDVLAVAQVGGIMAAKKTGDLIPMCHPINLTGVDINFEIDTEKSRIIITSTVSCKGETGVEMEALTAVSAAALTIYDMCKAVQKDMHIEGIKLLKKTGGKSGDYIAKD